MGLLSSATSVDDREGPRRGRGRAEGAIITYNNNFSVKCFITLRAVSLFLPV